MSDKRLNALNDYEQLKKRNRRRLIGASIMVVIAGALFIKAFSSGGNETANQQIDIQTASDIPDFQAASNTAIATASEASAPQIASDVSDVAVLEPTSEDASGVVEPLPETATAADNTPPAAPTTTVVKPAPVHTEPTTVAKPAQTTPTVKKDPVVAVKKEPVQSAKTPTKTTVAQKTETQPKAQTKEPSKKSTATTPTRNTPKKPSPQDILEGRAGTAVVSQGKVLIQAGAYSSADQAKRVQQTLANAGVSAYITEANTSKGKVYRVRSASYPNREAANRALDKIRAHGLDGIVIGQ